MAAGTGLGLNEEYKFRFDKKSDHKSAIIAQELPHPPIENHGLTEFAQAMPDQYKHPGDAVAAYRQFYLGEKAHFTTWTKRPIPEWFESGLERQKQS